MRGRVEYPDDLNCDQIGHYKTFEIFEDVIMARSYAHKIAGEIYTQVDCDGKIMYSKGIRYVNRTGIYAVVQ